MSSQQQNLSTPWTIQEARNSPDASDDSSKEDTALEEEEEEERKKHKKNFLVNIKIPKKEAKNWKQIEKTHR